MPDDTRGEPLATIAPAPATGSSFAFTPQQWVNFLLLRCRYRENQDLWNAGELAHLRFLRWLRTEGRLES
ncbi:MAG: hypothetical protein ACHQ4H_01650 [Ktedonobacterales bacterium]